MIEFDIYNSHSATLKNEKDFKYFKRELKDDGIVIQKGIKEDKTEEVQKIYFDNKIFTNEQLMHWLGENNHSDFKVNSSSSKKDSSENRKKSKRVAEIYLRF